MFIALCKNKHQIVTVRLFTAIDTTLRYDYRVTMKGYLKWKQ